METRCYYICSLLIAAVFFVPLTSVSATKLTVYAVQQKLTALGYQPGPVDGQWGKQTEAALVQFQRDQALEETGKVDAATKTQLDLVATPSHQAPGRTEASSGSSSSSGALGFFLLIALLGAALFGTGAGSSSSFSSDSLSSSMQINPATGLPMCGGLDIAGNPWGSSSNSW